MKTSFHQRLRDGQSLAGILLTTGSREVAERLAVAGLLVGQAALPALAGAAPEQPARSVMAIWAVAILLALGVRAPDGDAPAGKPVSAEE